MWAEEEARLGSLPPRAGVILEAVLFRGELRRGDVAALLASSERHGRRIVSALIERSVLMSESARAPLHLAFPAALAPRSLRDGCLGCFRKKWKKIPDVTTDRTAVEGVETCLALRRSATRMLG
jgi:hypothetical protein